MSGIVKCIKKRRQHHHRVLSQYVYSDGPCWDGCTRDSGYACRHDDQYHVQSHSYSFMGQGFVENELVTKKIELPKNWDKLVAKYKDIKPNYEKY
jgi:hypothetical protein